MAIPAANAHTGTCGSYFPSFSGKRGCPILCAVLGAKGGNETTSVSLAGHTATHSKHPVHSADRICTSLIHRQRRRTHLRAFRAINAPCLAPRDPHRARQRRQPQQRSIRTQIPAPEVLHQHRRDHEAQDHVAPQFRRDTERNSASAHPRSAHTETPRTAGSLPPTSPDTAYPKNASRRYFSPRSAKSSQRGSAEIAPEDKPSQLPQIFRHRSHRTQPPAKRLSQQPRHQHKRREQKERRRMHPRQLPAHQHVLELHQPGDRQPSFHSRRTRHLARRPRRLRPAHPLVELHADPHIQRHEPQLEAQPKLLRVVSIAAPHQLLARDRHHLWRRRKPIARGRQWTRYEVRTHLFQPSGGRPCRPMTSVTNRPTSPHRRRNSYC